MMLLLLFLNDVVVVVKLSSARPESVCAADGPQARLNPGVESLPGVDCQVLLYLTGQGKTPVTEQDGVVKVGFLRRNLQDEEHKDGHKIHCKGCADQMSHNVH